jgi:mercuric ion binding protein
MKQFILFVFTVVVLVSCNRIPEETRVLAVGPSDSVLTLEVPNAGCPKCQNIVETGLLELGAKQSILNLHTKQVSIVYSPDEVSQTELENKVQSLLPELPCK